MKFLSLDSPLMQFLSKVADYMLMSLMLIIFSLPVFTVGPAVTALHRTLIRRDSGCEGSVVGIFLQAVRDDFKKSLYIELAFLPVLFVSVLLLLFAADSGRNSSLAVLIMCFLPAVLTVFALSYVFPMNAQFDNTPFNTVKNAYIMAVAHLPVSLAVSAINLMPFALAYFRSDLFLKTIPYFTLIGFSVMGKLIHLLLGTVFKRYIPKEEAASETGQGTEER